VNQTSKPDTSCGCNSGRDGYLIYLDNGATSFPKPPEVIVAMEHACRVLGVNPGRSGYDLCREAGRVIEETRMLLARFFGGPDPERLVFTANATDALNLAIFGLLGPGDHAISSALDHNSTLRPLWHLSEQGVEVEHVGFDERGYIDPDDVIRRFRPNTRAVVLNHGSNVIGTVQPLAPIGRACRARGIHLVVDVSQTAGVAPVNLDDLGADVLCFTGHKSLLGPMGTGGMYVRAGVDIRHTRAGWRLTTHLAVFGQFSESLSPALVSEPPRMSPPLISGQASVPDTGNLTGTGVSFDRRVSPAGISLRLMSIN